GSAPEATMSGEDPSPTQQLSSRVVRLAFVLAAAALAALAVAAWLAYGAATPAALVALGGIPLLGAALVLLRRDAAARRQMLDARRGGEEALREADQHRAAFLALPAHERRTPRARVRSALELMRRRGPERRAAGRRAREVIERQVRHMTRLIDDLLDV